MIYVKRDPKLIPAYVLAAAERASAALEALPADQRLPFIEKNSRVWKAFKQHLAAMSYGKCWYSEAGDPQSIFDVDHFRPKKNAIRDIGVSDPGYPWLAFSWKNFRYSAERSSRLTTNEITEETEGKGSWFPLLPGSAKATWEDRCINSEQPILIDPTSRHDVRLVDITTDGLVAPSHYCNSAEQERVTRSAIYLGLNLPRLTSARKKVIRDAERIYKSMLRSVGAGLSIKDEMSFLYEQTLPSSPFSQAARGSLMRLGAGRLCASPEEG